MSWDISDNNLPYFNQQNTSFHTLKQGKSHDKLPQTILRFIINIIDTTIVSSRNCVGIALLSQ